MWVFFIVCGLITVILLLSIIWIINKLVNKMKIDDMKTNQEIEEMRSSKSGHNKA